MVQESAQIQAVRRRLIELVEDDAILMLEEVEREARRTLSAYQKCQSQYDVIDFVLGLLKADHPLSIVDLANRKLQIRIENRPCTIESRDMEVQVPRARIRHRSSTSRARRGSLQAS